MQATVHRYDADADSGQVLTDEGLLLPFGPEAMRGSGLRHLRPGQRLTVTIDGEGADRHVATLRLGRVGRSPSA